MGQYYMPVLIDGEDKRFLYSHDYGNGLKLMEHSWIGNNFVNAVMAHMVERPVRLAWMGDYSDACYEELQNKDTVPTYEEYEALYKGLWDNSDIEGAIPKADSKKFDLDPKKVYLVDFDKKEYISILNYMERVAAWDNPESKDIELWYINPLPLLTAVGNGQGGGDYWSAVGENQVGSWAFDPILVTDDPDDIPQEFMENLVVFSE